MLTHCPSCQQAIPFTDDQMRRLTQALSQLVAGKRLSFQCPLCLKTISLNAADIRSQNAAVGQVQPPPPPSLSWLSTSCLQTEDRAGDAPLALVLHQDDDQRKGIVLALEAVGYQVFMADTAPDAIERMLFVNFSCVVFHIERTGGIEDSSFHAHMRSMGMERRRSIFYILIGAHLHTLYNLEALAYSANLTVNTAELQHLERIVRRAVPLHEKLFGPLLEALSLSGKR